ncbi:thermonuclease family protein [Devosia sp. CAU 1758]
MKTSNQAYWRRRGRRRRVNALLARLSIVPTAMLAMMIGSLAVLSLEYAGLGAWLSQALPAATPTIDAAVVRSFGPCGSHRFTCVVDGDTFWLDGTRIRIADINTPEISAPQCAHEALLGRRASDRLAQLLSAGPFTLSGVERDEDQYGRKLRIVRRGGQSLGGQLVAEGLAHEWQGRRESWC